MSLLIGIDGGGTKTDMILCNSDGNILNHIKLGSSNPNDIGMNQCQETIKNGINLLLKNHSKKNVLSIFAGISGGTTGDNQQKINKFLNSFMDATTLVSNHSDAVNALASGVKNDGCVVIAGTGSIGYARKGMDIFRVGGYGYMIDKGGSGFDFGRDVIYSALHHKDGSGEPTIITDIIESKTGDLLLELGNIYIKSKPYIASFAPIVFEAYKLGDEVAKKIVECNCIELAKLFNTLAKYVNCNVCETVISGSIFKNFDILKEHLAPKLNFEFNFIIPKLPPVYGSIAEAAKIANILVDDKFSDNFEKSLKEV